MKPDRIAEIVETYAGMDKLFKIVVLDDHFFVGSFVKTIDYEELKDKNHWRVVRSNNLHKWDASNNLDLSEIFDGDIIDDITIV